jgi:PIN domain nuclease of toxin-antitoxin system
MKYLLDTMVFLWSQGCSSRLSREAEEVLSQTTNEIYLSSASSWEIAIKAAIGKLELPEPAATYVPKRLRMGAIQPLPITHAHALAAPDLPPHHQDPFDRMLIAQARSEHMVLMTADRVFSKYKVQFLWCGH